MRSDSDAIPTAGRYLLVGGYLAVLAALARYAIGSHDQRFVATGDSFPGTATSIAALAGYFTATLSGALVLGLLAYIVTTARPDERGVIDVDAFRLHIIAERAAAVWAVSAAAMIPIQAANNAGVAVTRLLTSGALGDALGATEMARGWVAATIFAGVVAVGLRWTVRWVWHTMLLIPALIAVIAVPVTGNAGQGLNHDYATGAVIVFVPALAVLVGVKIGAVLNPPDALLRRRVLLIGLLSGGMTLLYGVLLLALLVPAASLVGSDYGLLALLAAAVLGAVWAGDVSAAIRSRTGPLPPSPGSARTGALAVILVAGAISAMAVQTAPVLLTHPMTTWDVFLGYALPDPPTARRLLTTWRFDPLLGVGALLLAGGYLTGVLRMRRRGDGWPVGRTVAWLLGCLMLLLATSSGIGAYGAAMFSVHMGQHMALNMVIPVLLVLGAPVTLALRTLPTAGTDPLPRARDWLLWLIHSPVTHFIAHPITAFSLFVGSLYAVYFTPAFDTLIRYHWGHQFMAAHFLITGYLYFWGIIGIDPGPRRLPFLGRLGLLFAVMPFHSFFGVATMTTDTAIGGRFYRSLNLPWLPDLMADQHLGGAIAWGSSELPVIVVVVALVTLWARHDRRAAERSDRHSAAAYAVDELDAYNAMLQELARTRR